MYKVIETVTNPIFDGFPTFDGFTIERYSDGSIRFEDVNGNIVSCYSNSEMTKLFKKLLSLEATE